MDLEEAAVVVEASQEVPTVILTSADVLLLLGRFGMLASSSFAFSSTSNTPTTTTGAAVALNATSR